MNSRYFATIGFLDIAAVATWTVVFGISVYDLQHNPASDQANLPLTIGLFLVYIGCFLLITRDDWLPDIAYATPALLCVQLAAVFGLLWLLPLDFLPILTIVWVAMLPSYVSLRISIGITLLVLTLWFTIDAAHWGNSGAVFSGLLYGTFHLFALFAIDGTRSAQEASRRSEGLNKELKATQQLLAEASRQNERTRIARDLHDLLGHHLTALIINLQVAERQSEGDTRAKIEQCHSLAKLLMSDVREAVSTLRENEELDFPKLVQLMLDNTPTLKVHTEIDAALNLEDLELAKSLLSCIQEALTNSLRHSGATEFWLTVQTTGEMLTVELRDNGLLKKNLKLANGLNGMRERVESFGGKWNWQRVQNALTINFCIPLNTKLKSE